MKDWIDDIAEQSELKREQAAADIQASLAAERLLEQETPEFIRQLGVELQAMVNKLPKIRVEGSFSDNSQENFETRYHISLRRASLNPEITEIHVFHQPRTHVVRCHPLRRAAFELHFTVNPNGCTIALFSKSNLSPMNPYQAAQFIMQPEVDMVRPRS